MTHNVCTHLHTPTAKEKKACSGLLLKVNQIGTVTESIKACAMAHEEGWGVMVSHRYSCTFFFNIFFLVYKTIRGVMAFHRCSSMCPTGIVDTYNTLNIHKYRHIIKACAMHGARGGLGVMFPETHTNTHTHTQTQTQTHTQTHKHTHTHTHTQVGRDRGYDHRRPCCRPWYWPDQDWCPLPRRAHCQVQPGIHIRVCVRVCVCMIYNACVCSCMYECVCITQMDRSI